MSINGNLNLKTLHYGKEKVLSQNKFLSTPKNLTLRIKNIRFYQLPKGLSNKLEHKIVKEALILGLREELIHNKKMKKTLTKYLEDVNRLKEKVKKNKEDVEENCEKLKQEFYDRFQIIDNYEKQINLLNEEKKEIIRTNNEIISMKNKITFSLKKQLDKIQKEIDEQRGVIEDLKKKILVLEDKKANLDKEFEKIIEKEEIKYKELKVQYSALYKKYEYYEIEYNKFEKYPEELIKEDINLFDRTNANYMLTEENLKIELAEKNQIKDKLLNSVDELQKQIHLFEEKQKEIKEKEKLYGKPLSDINKKTKKINNKTMALKTNSFINTNSSYGINKRAKTIPSKTKRSFL
jgi:chromosome segregation ATPase